MQAGETEQVEDENPIFDKIQALKQNLNQMELDVKKTLVEKTLKEQQLRQREEKERLGLITTDEEFMQMPAICTQFFIMNNEMRRVGLARKKQAAPKDTIKQYQYLLQHPKVKDYIEERLPQLARVEENQVVENLLKPVEKPQIPQIKDEAQIYHQIHSLPPLIEIVGREAERTLFRILPLYVEN